LLGALALAAVASGGCVNLDAEPEPVVAVTQPDASAPIFNRYIDSPRGQFYARECALLEVLGDECQRIVSNAVGDGRLFVSSEFGERVDVFDASTYAYIRTIQHPSMKKPRGVAFYRGELFVMDGRGTIFVFDAASAVLKRQFDHPAKYFAGTDTPQSPYGSWDTGELYERVAITGIDVAWNEIWTTFRGGAGGGGIVVFNAKIGRAHV
jgi:outer membrane protein assembly factor BamB